MHRLLFCWFFCLLSYGETNEGFVDQPINCTEISRKSTDYCLVESNVCQAVFDQPLLLHCAPCPDDSLVYWNLWDNSTYQGEKYFLVNTTLTGINTSGCAACRCEDTGSSFSVYVEPAVFPMFNVPVSNETFPAGYLLLPPTVTVNLTMDSEGTVCVNCSAYGYPDVNYTWFYKEDGGERLPITADTSLWSPPGQPEILCQIPTIDNVKKVRTFECHARNFAGTSKAFQTVQYSEYTPFSSWFARPHRKQTDGGVMAAASSGASAYCAAYPQDNIAFTYYVCGIPEDINTSMVVGLYQQGKLNCCECGQLYEKCPLQTVELVMENVTDHLGIPASSCRVNVIPTGTHSLACIVTKNLNTEERYSVSAPQILGTFHVRQVHSYVVKTTIPMWVLILLSAVVVTTFALTVSAFGWMLYYRKRYNGIRKANHEEDEYIAGGPENLAVGDQQPQQQYEEEEESERDSFKERDSAAHQRPFSLHLSLTTPAKNGENQPLLSTCSIENYYSINEVLDRVEEQQENGLRCRVRRRHQQLINSLCIDGQLLAALHERELLTELQRQEIHTRLERNDPPLRTSSYVIGSVVFHWAESVFDSNMEEFSKALSEHSDSGNKRLGEVLSQMLNYPSPD